MKSWFISHFNPFSCFLKDFPHYSLLVLNSKLGNNFNKLWDNADYRIAVDGGANRIYDYLHKDNNNNTIYPYIIKGDLDSIRNDVKDFYKDKSFIYHDTNQDTTDLQKNLQLFLYHNELKTYKHPIFICGGLGGNLSHVIANIQSIIQFSNQITNSIYLLSDNNIGCYLNKGSHTIHGYDKMFCSFIPLESNCFIKSSSNLMYPLDKLTLKFGSLVSTSNQFISNSITLDISNPLLFIADSRDN